ncbi:hypothetical protein E8E13_003912 [Curvularia kusanoi]|uniref:Uncharacterized protein n=1 Tax=Curvularia kusanoi TaxID=90978 RepID=A0A9P4W580_CURKU|nr:hypothetical protein E8E13_003912 [Curvularia kusanoi]
MNTNEEAPNDTHKRMLEQVREILNAASDLYQGDLLLLISLFKLEFSPETTGFHYLSAAIARLIKPNLTYMVAFINCVVDAPVQEVSQTTKDDVLRDVGLYLGEVSIDMRTHEAVERQLAAIDEMQDKDGFVARPMAKLSPGAFGLFTKRFYGIGQFLPVESMLACLQLEMKHALVMDLHSIYVPFLQHLVGLMLMYGIPMQNDTYSAFFDCVLCNYLERFVGIDSEDENSAEHNAWSHRANAARIMLGSFEHSYFEDILGARYESTIKPAYMKLPSATVGHGRFDSLDPSSVA